MFVLLQRNSLGFFFLFVQKDGVQFLAQSPYTYVHANLNAHETMHRGSALLPRISVRRHNPNVDAEDTIDTFVTGHDILSHCLPDDLCFTEETFNPPEETNMVRSALPPVLEGCSRLRFCPSLTTRVLRQWDGTPLSDLSDAQDRIFMCDPVTRLRAATARAWWTLCQLQNSICIQTGTCLYGHWNKPKINRITHAIAKDFGFDVAERFIHGTQLVSTYALSRLGPTVGISDCLNPREKECTDMMDKV